MSYYNPNTYGLDASLSENMQPIEASKVPVNRYIAPRGYELNSAANTLNYVNHGRANHICYIPIVVDTTTTFDRIGFFYYGANNCTSTWYYDLGLYSGNLADEYPDTKLADYGTVTIIPGTTTAPSTNLITINQTLDANQLYFLALGIRWSDSTDFNNSRSPFLLCGTGNFSMFFKRGLSGVSASSSGYGWMEQIGSYSGTLPTSTTYANSSSVVSIAPRLGLRKSA